MSLGPRTMEPVLLYRRRNPRSTPLWKLSETLYERLHGEWEERFEARFGFWRGLADEAVRVNGVTPSFFASRTGRMPCAWVFARGELTSIIGWASLLEREPDSATIAEAARSIASSAAVQAKLIDDLLDVSRIMTGKFAITVEEIDLGSVIDGAVSGMRPLAS